MHAETSPCTSENLYPAIDKWAHICRSNNSGGPTKSRSNNNVYAMQQALPRNIRQRFTGGVVLLTAIEILNKHKS